MRFAIPRDIFLERRRRDLLFAKSEANRKKDGVHGFNVIVIDAGDEIICDRCNAEITSESIVLDLRLNCVLCPDCLANED